MRPLTVDDLLPLDEYVRQRRELLEAQRRYVDRYRRVRLGPRVTLLFENRQTLWYRLQELVRIARLIDPERVQQELDLQNRLLPRAQQLQAALVIDIPDEHLSEELAAWQTLSGDDLRFCIGTRQTPATLITCRPEDRASGTAHWVQFIVDEPCRRLLKNFRQPAYFEMKRAGYEHQSSSLSEDVRQSLLDDLELSDKD